MKEIGEYLKNARVQNGVSLEEASEDLNLSSVQLEHIEEGNIRAFKDVFILKDLIHNYAKYLGLELDVIMNDFNDFMFEHTSKISLNNIKGTKDLKKQDDPDKVVSPYTKIKPPKNFPIKPIVVVLSGILLLLLFIYIIIQVNSKEENISSELMRSEVCDYEFTY
ncbi:MAG: helix-turn-helix domain-containing protein [bacterium]|nr:helix-turn-helix domain-containing protein [bacterium]